jgi:PadR family transcriptional regulator, regulatory protein PadR
MAVEMPREYPMGSLELLIIAAVIGLPEGGYGIEIGDRIKRQARKDVSLGALYTALDRLEQRGFLRSKWGEPTAERGGRRKRYFSVTARGERAFREAQNNMAALGGFAPRGA